VHFRLTKVTGISRKYNVKYNVKYRCIQLSDTKKTYPIHGTNCTLMNMVFNPIHLNRKICHKN